MEVYCVGVYVCGFSVRHAHGVRFADWPGRLRPRDALPYNRKSCRAVMCDRCPVFLLVICYLYLLVPVGCRAAPAAGGT